MPSMPPASPTKLWRNLTPLHVLVYGVTGWQVSRSLVIHENFLFNVLLLQYWVRHAHAQSGTRALHGLSVVFSAPMNDER